MRMVGLTGGIASGKSTVSKELGIRGVPVIDADKIAHDVLRKGTRGWKRVVGIFGQDILLGSGEVNRARLGEIVFADPAKRKQLNKALEPFIAFGLWSEIFKQWLYGTHVVVLDVPLLFEAKLTWMTKPIVVVWVDRETQEARLLKRDHLPEEQARNRILAQLPLEVKRDKADIVIDNTGTLENTKLQVDQLFTTINAPLSLKELLLSRTGVLCWVTGVVILGWLLL
ncbi:dephospho-CoA kinase [Marchantia polymorpha subsp. ruderalis]|uniref:Dephospho-CoA kinase n=2 Tax=Marchantia polymorpha TaxID=3197 RepID=A0A176W778_MARPO|nr:hypothetical protein AXG93_2490s1120 [Marchantia polymorpha subsp. ruderalis]PTQ42736.1 hypothetical protein MARPO_0028s0053 [Marchantia polymorpha]BBN00660.1 hypothetical protein Mp_2g00980 [Marchantia polymorpha subsp. ruderalis]|eukprot:PTQ42736.1 hypothetical protein MARPO_0028s0053 [Marchantia polymorpha]